MIDAVIALAAVLFAYAGGIMSGHAVGFYRGRHGRGVRRPQ